MMQPVLGLPSLSPRNIPVYGYITAVHPFTIWDIWVEYLINQLHVALVIANMNYTNYCQFGIQNDKNKKSLGENKDERKMNFYVCTYSKDFIFK